MGKAIFEQIVRKSGNSLVATIPKEVADGMNLSSGVKVKFLIELDTPEIEFWTEKDGDKYTVSLLDDYGALYTYKNDEVQESLELSCPPHLLALYNFIQEMAHDPEIIKQSNEFYHSPEELAFDEDEE